MWVHGHSAVIELNNRGRAASEDINNIQWSALLGERVGWGVIYRGQDNSNYWFHLAIPTPVIMNDRRARLIRAMVLYTTDPQLQLRSVHVWDGPNRIFTRDGLSVGGANLTLVDNVTSFALPNQEVFCGIGISLLFN